MKLLLAVLMIFGLVACDEAVKGRNGEVYKSAPEYNNYIIDRQKRVGVYITKFYDQLNSDPDSAAALLAKGLHHVIRCIREINDMPDYKGDSSFRHSAIKSFGFYKRLFEVDYPTILAWHRKGLELTDEEREQEGKMVDQIIRDEDQYDKDLHNRQRDFAERNHMTLSKAEKQKD